MPTALPSTINNVSVVPDAEASDRFFFGPGEPGPKRDAMGRPVLMMLPSGTGAQLQMAVRWAVEEDVLDEIREQIARAVPDLKPEHVRLAPLPASVDVVRVVLYTPGGDDVVLGESTSSGTYPYDALFNLSLDAEQTALVLRALHGEPGVLQVRYEGALLPKTRAEVRVSGDASDLLAALPEEPDEDMVRDRVEAAIASGTLREDVKGGGSDAALDHVRHQACEAAVALLLGMVQGEEASESAFSLDAVTRLSESDTVPMEVATDLADWLDAGMLASLVHVQPGDVDLTDDEEPGDVSAPVDGDPAGETGRTIQIRSAVDLGAAGIRHVRIRRTDGKGGEVVIRDGDATGVLDGVPASSALEVNVSYMGFGSDYSSEVTAPAAADEPELDLSTADLGVTLVTVDATALVAEDVRQARVAVRYVPSGDGDRHSETLHLRGESWEADWYVVTRSPLLAGVLRVDAVIHGSEGRERRQYETDDPMIVL